MLSHHLILCHPLLCLPSIFPNIRVFSSESALHIRFPKYWSFNFSISPSSEYSRLISLRIDWFDLFAVQGTLRCLLQHHSLKASILWCSAFFMVQLSYHYPNFTSLAWLEFISYASKAQTGAFDQLIILLQVVTQESRLFLLCDPVVFNIHTKVASF